MAMHKQDAARCFLSPSCGAHGVALKDSTEYAKVKTERVANNARKLVSDQRGGVALQLLFSATEPPVRAKHPTGSALSLPREHWKHSGQGIRSDGNAGIVALQHDHQFIPGSPGLAQGPARRTDGLGPEVDEDAAAIQADRRIEPLQVCLVDVPWFVTGWLSDAQA
jgi:hypothetical protein